VGFSEASTFHRAFKGWTGLTPGAYRQAHNEPADGNPVH
jgi:AraC-like DNA-binding protein